MASTNRNSLIIQSVCTIKLDEPRDGIDTTGAKKTDGSVSSMHPTFRCWRVLQRAGVVPAQTTTNATVPTSLQRRGRSIVLKVRTPSRLRDDMSFNPGGKHLMTELKPSRWLRNPGPSIAKSVFRAEGSRRPFRRGDLAILASRTGRTPAGSIVLIDASERGTEARFQDLAFTSIRGIAGHAPACDIWLLAGIDTQEFAPGYDELAQMIADNA